MISAPAASALLPPTLCYSRNHDSPATPVRRSRHSRHCRRLRQLQDGHESARRRPGRLERVTGYRPVKAGDGYKARCPCHEDRNPSLSVKMNGRLLLHCFAGCSYERIVAALGLTPEPPAGRRNS